MSDTEKTIKRAEDNYKQDRQFWSDIYTKASEDMFFQSDDKNAQWDSTALTNRTDEGRPSLTIDQLGQFVHQVANDIRMNTPTITIIPNGSDSSIETAEILKGLIKNIEYVSNADEAYDTASVNSIKSSIGFIRVENDYIDDSSFEQELKIRRVVNPLQCWIDCASTEVDGSDATRGIEIESLQVSIFNKRYPGKEPVSFADEDENKNKDLKDEDYVNVATYYEIIEESKDVGVSEDGEMQEAQEGVEYKARRTMKKKKVMKYVLSGVDILEKAVFPGKYIPLIPVYGEEAWVDGKREIYSLIRKSKDAQRMFNYWKSLETELLMKQPNAPIMAVGGTTENYADDWKNPNKSMVLRYDATDADGNPAPAPSRLAPPTIPTGIVNAARATVDDIKATMGLYGASIGARSNETSGIAIERRNQEGEVATFHFGDNLNKSITHVGKILVCAIPEIYDTARVLRIIGEEDEAKEVGINGKTVKDQEATFDLRKGKYDTRVVTGASFTTKRQEAAQFFTSIVEKQPQLMEVMGDLLFKNMDFAGAQGMAARMEKIIDPKFLVEEEEEEVDPEKEQMAMVIQEGAQQMEQMQTQIEEMQEKLESKDAEILIKAESEKSKAQDDYRKTEIDLMNAKTNREKVTGDYQTKMEMVALKREEMAQKERDRQEQLLLKAHEIKRSEDAQQESEIPSDS